MRVTQLETRLGILAGRTPQGERLLTLKPQGEKRRQWDTGDQQAWKVIGGPILQWIRRPRNPVEINGRAENLQRFRPVPRTECLLKPKKEDGKLASSWWKELHGLH